MSTTAINRELQRELAHQRKLIEVTNAINAAPNVQEILLTLKDLILQLIDADRVTVFAVDTKNQELYSLYKIGEIPKEIRVAKNTKSIAGFCAVTKTTVMIADAYDEQELQAIHPQLRFDRSWDSSTGYRTRQVLATPLIFDKFMVGVLQLINRTGGGTFGEQDREAVQEIARVLAIALYNQSRVAARPKPSKFGYLLENALITQQQLEAAASEARINQISTARVLMKRFGVSQQDLGRSLALFYDMPFWAYDGISRVPDELRERLPVDVLRKMGCAPVERRPGGALVIAVDDPADLKRLDAVRTLGVAPRYEFRVALVDDIGAYLDASYGPKSSGTPKQATVEVTEARPEIDAEADIGQIMIELGEDLDDAAAARAEEALIDDSDTGIVRLVNRIIIAAYERGASDIHIEPRGLKRPCKVRFRVDGQLADYLEVPGPHRNALVQRLKIIAMLDISERRLPQDGKIRFRGPKDVIELRVATLPTANDNEDVVMRILAASKPLPLEKMAFSARNIRCFKEAVSKPYGIFLVVGPTGSGKTTTLHSALGYINTPDRKIWTAEDPVEITQEGLRQVQMRARIGLDFARTMRAFLRADPDVIMVGEMRDPETAGIGVEASLTGHLVMSTLHTNSAPETVTRLLDMEIDPFNFADALLGILAQRLVRTLCQGCKQPYRPEEEEILEIVQAYGPQDWASSGIEITPETRLYRAAGCSQCTDTGYRGRMGIHELMVGTDEVKRVIQRRQPVEELRAQAKRDGMRTLLQDGIEKVFQGHTDFKQVRAVAIK